MSYCETLGFTEDGKVLYLTEYRNAHGWAAYIWTMLQEKYIGSGSWLSNPDKVWKLADSDRLTDEEKITLWSTFDRSLVRVSEIPMLIRAYEAFLRKYPPHEHYVCHLPKMIEELKTVHDNPENIVAIGWYGMSVGDNPWSKYDEDKGADVDYDITIGTEHHFLGDFLKDVCPTYAQPKGPISKEKKQELLNKMTNELLATPIENWEWCGGIWKTSLRGHTFYLQGDEGDEPFLTVEDVHMHLDTPGSTRNYRRMLDLSRRLYGSLERETEAEREAILLDFDN